MVDGFIRKPALDVVQGDLLGPMHGKVSAAATVTYMFPGKLVKYSAANDSIDIAGNGDVSGNIGILGYESASIQYKPATRDTAYARGDHVPLHNTPGVRFRGWVLTSTAITPGMLLTHPDTDASGNFGKFVGPGTTGMRPLSRALESIGATGTVVPCWMELI